MSESKDGVGEILGAYAEVMKWASSTGNRDVLLKYLEAAKLAGMCGSSIPFIMSEMNCDQERARQILEVESVTARKRVMAMKEAYPIFKNLNDIQ